jgi:hypothetical protein
MGTPDTFPQTGGSETMCAPRTVDKVSQERDHFGIATEYYVNQATVPLGVALYVCACGARQVECDLSHDTPDGWAIAADGSCLCPRCASSNETRKPES